MQFKNLWSLRMPFAWRRKRNKNWATVFNENYTHNHFPSNWMRFTNFCTTRGKHWDCVSSPSSHISLQWWIFRFLRKKWKKKNSTKMLIYHVIQNDAFPFISFMPIISMLFFTACRSMDASNLPNQFFFLHSSMHWISLEIVEILCLCVLTDMRKIKRNKNK